VTAASTDVLRWVEIDVDILARNASVITMLVRPAAVMAMVKSNGYGHGIQIAAQAALDGGATWLGVYTPGEAIELRRAGVTVRTLVLGWTPILQSRLQRTARQSLDEFLTQSPA